jgi:regulator of sirC expression with transglutaminase-like and TPR domain
MVDDPTARFAALVADLDAPLPIDEGLVLIAAHADADVDVAAELGRLDALGAAVEEPSVAALLDLLFDRLGFAGDRTSYYAAENSLLPAVLDRRRGIPLSLSLLTIEVARRAGIAIEGIGMPGHYLVRPVAAPEQFLDVYDGGRALDATGCRARFEELHADVPWDDRYLRPDVPWRQLARTLQNLAGAYRRSRDRAALTWTLRLRHLLPGLSDRDRRELGVLLGAEGRYGEAAAVLEGSGAAVDAAAAQRLRARLN